MLGLIHSLFGSRRARPKPSYRPTLEGLEDRCLLSNNVLQTNLVSDLPGVAQHTDPNLVNPWGISESSGGPFWVSDNNAGVATLYNTPGVPQSLVVSIPTPGDPTGASGAPTGTVFNIDGGKNGGFVVTNGTASASSIFLFATEDGTIVGWNPGVNPVGSDAAKAGTFGTIAVDNSGNNFTEPDPAKQTGAVYKGLAIATGPNGPIFAGDAASGTVLYASNFRSGKIDVFDANFHAITLPKGAFSDPNLPKGYAPFNVQALTVNGVTKIYVTYALQNGFKHDDVGGLGHGFIDVFNLDGTPGLAGGHERLVSRGALDSPWGLAIAPASFGSLGGALLVGNFRNGHINAYSATTGASMGALTDPDGEPIVIDGLWALKVGNGGNGGDADKVYFTAGLDHEQHGLFGSLSSVAAGTPEGPAEQEMVQAAIDVFQIALSTLGNDLVSGAPKATINQDIQNVITSLHDATQAEFAFAVDAAKDAGAHVHLPVHSADELFTDELAAILTDIALFSRDFH
jgi:uncharacterized protein (TIGR03118 family)